MEAHRAERLAEAIRESLHELIHFRLEDPRIGSLDIVSVVLSPDGRKAVVQVRPVGGSSATETVDALRHAKPFLRRELAESLDLFRAPDLYFEAVTGGVAAARVPALLRRVRRGRPRE
jgi:ribosome-binding factor A